MIRFYLVPVEVTPVSRGPKYFPYRFDPDPPALTTALPEVQYFGSESNACLVAADVNDADSALIASQPDVTKFADDLDQQLGADLATMQSALEALNLPAQMLTAATTHRRTIRGILAIFAITQCMRGKGFRVFGGAVTLATTMGALSVNVRQALQTCATDKGYDVSSVTLANTVREVLSILVQQAAPIRLQGVQI